MQNLDFEPVRIERKPEYDRLLRLTDSAASDYSFVNIWGWRKEYELSWAWQDGFVWVRQEKPQLSYWAPVGPWKETDWKDYFRRNMPEPPPLIRCPELLTRIWEEQFGSAVSAEPIQDHWDYLYDATELIELKGNRFHKKKNLLNQFLKTYSFTYRPLGPELIQQALSMQEDWCLWRDCESVETLMAESRVIAEVLAHWEQLGELFGGALFVDDRMAAFTVAEALNPKTVLIHFEKGLAEFKGVYQAINQIFLSHHADFQRVNREQDLGEEGLRKAKQSYHPIDFVKKYRIKFTL